MKTNKTPTRKRLARVLLMAALGLGAVASLQGCMGLAVGGAVASGAAAMDRRSIGAQTDDKAFVLKAQSRISPLLNDQSTVDVSAYNRSILLTGDVPDVATRQKIVDAVASIPDVQSVDNEIQVGFPLSFSQRTDDTYITSKVVAALINAQGISQTSFKIVTSHKVVYMMGIVTRREAEVATQTASQVSGVAKVVKLFEYISDAELDNMKQTAK